MEITSFVLGMLTIVAVIILTVIVVGLVKINQTVKRLNTLNTNLDRYISDIYRNVQEENQSIWRQFENTGRDITMVEKTLMSQIDKTRKETDQAIDQLHRIDAELNENARRYTDSRIDKLRTEQDSKQILKG